MSRWLGSMIRASIEPGTKLKGLTMTRMVRVVGFVLILSGCVPQGRGDPLYPTEGGVLPPPESVATLGGLIQTVDGLSVPEGHRFELLPGCHVVVNVAHWTHSDSQNSVTATLHQLSFAIDMRAGYSYIVRVQEGLWTGTSGSIRLLAEERDPTGNVTRDIAPGQPCSGPATTEPAP